MESLNYRIKVILLVFIAIAMGILSYRRAFKATFQLYDQYHELLDNKLSQQEVLMQSNLIKAELKQVERYLGNNTSNVQHIILEDVSQFCARNKIHLAQVENPVVIVENDLKTSTYEITLQGNYKKILKLVHFLEYDFKEAVLVSTEYYTTDNHNNKRKELYAKLYLQSIDKL